MKDPGTFERGNRRISLLGTSFLALWAVSAAAQEAINEAQEVEVSRRARKEAIDRNLYNLKAGPVLLRFDAGMGFEVNDNPHLVEDPDKVDFAFRPQINIGSVWLLSAENVLSLNLGIGYVKYIHNDDLDQLLITPASELSFDILVGDVTINLHERISYTQNPVRDPSVSGTGDFGGIENTLGLRVDWDLNRLVLTAGYDHFNFFSSGSELSDIQERSSELFYTRAEVKVNPGLQTGLEVGGGLTDYNRNVLADNTHFSVGPFVEMDLSRELKMRASGGYLRYDFDATSGTARLFGTNVFVKVPDSVDDFYADLSFDHQLSAYMTHRLSLGREARAGASSELMTLWYARYQNNWNVSRLAMLHTTAFYERGRERAGFVSERLWRVGAGAAVSVPLSRKLTVTVGYQLVYKDSDQVLRDYLQNVGTVDVRYAF